jgi:two-component system cell cycle response regulator
MKILIAEDEPSSRLVLKKAIEKLGHECLVAEDGHQAWALFQSREVDVVISDWMMPGIDGIELCRRVREYSTSTYPYFIFLTSLADREHCLMGLEAGADDYLTKPLNLFDLKARLLVALRVTALHLQLAQQNTELERLNKLLFEQAHKDPLTQLSNRLRLQEDLETLQDRALRYHQGCCAALCDIDFFKAFNDRYGHQAGDKVLRIVAETIQHSLRGSDAVYRYGGEEFLILMPEQTIESGSLAAHRILQAVENLEIPHEGNPQTGILTMSAGVAGLDPSDGKTMAILLKEADEALYLAKGSGRNRVAVSAVKMAS